MNRLLAHFTNTKPTTSGEWIGLEIETILTMASGEPISQGVSRAIRTYTMGRPAGCVHSIDLSRATFELAVGPCQTWGELLELAHKSLHWLYAVAARFGAVPFFGPELDWSRPLVDVTSDPRDQVWVQLDGQAALEHLTCASVQFNVDVSQAGAVPIINELWARRIHEVDFGSNDVRWRRYIAESRAAYHPIRYAGPSWFADLADYARQLSGLPVVMHQGNIARLDPLGPESIDIELFLRSVWWHYRLRVRRGKLVLEIRPFARRSDECLEKYWGLVASVIGL